MVGDLVGDMFDPDRGLGSGSWDNDGYGDRDYDEGGGDWGGGVGGDIF